MVEGSNLTYTYSSIHAALAVEADLRGVQPFDLRVLLAVDDHDGPIRTDQVERVLRADGAPVRRSYPLLRTLGWVTAEATGGGPPKRGTRTTLTVTDEGREVAAAIKRRVDA